MDKTAKRVYFPGLNGIRAIAAVGVMVSHVFRAMNRFPGHLRYSGPEELANQGVIMFFTLSGFLITFLLLQERADFGRIDFRAFYMRRILRIWPLYFFYIGLAMVYYLLFEPGVPLNAAYVTLYVFFLPNIAFNLGRTMPDTAALWSIGIEEQFYAVWPLITSKISKLSHFLCVLVVALLGLRIVAHSAFGSGKHLVTSIVDCLGYDSMAIGALFAIMYRAENRKLLSIARSWIPHVLFVALICLLAFNKLEFLSLLMNPVTSVLTGLFIVSQICGSRKPINLEQPAFNYLGKISYGVYVYHMLVCTLVARGVRAFAPSSTIPSPAIVVLVSAATVGVAALSYRFLESPFLRLKNSLARVRTAAAA